MRCRKVRSLLSAASFDELHDKKQVAIREHLTSCQACRTEASHYGEIRTAVKEVERPTLSEDFNTRLLNRIAEERFAETRTKAFIPKKAPLPWWASARTLAPAVTAVALVAFALVSMQNTGLTPDTVQDRLSAISDIIANDDGTPQHMDDRYLHVQPTSNPNMEIKLDRDWQMQDRMAQLEKHNRWNGRLSNQYGFSQAQLTGAHNGLGQQGVSPKFFFQPQPMLRIYQAGTPAATQGGAGTY